MADFLKSIGGILGAIAPTIATALGGPFAGQAVSALVSALGLPADASQDQLARAIQIATPDQLAAIKTAEYEFQSKMKQLDVDLEAVAQKDRTSARDRQVQMHDSTPANLAYLLTAGFFGLLGYAAFRAFPAENATFLNIMLGSLGTAWVASMTFFFGSTKGSQAKDFYLANSVPSGGAAAGSVVPFIRASEGRKAA